MRKIFVFGHKNPDSDTICSALAYAELKKSQGVHAVAVKLGELNSETKFILKYFQVQEPDTLDTIKTQVSDLQFDKALCVGEDVSIRSAWQRMKENAQKSLAVVNEEKELLGLATLSDITKNLMDTSDDMLLMKSRTSYKNIAETLEAVTITGSLDKKTAAGRVLVAAHHQFMMKNYIKNEDIVFANIDANIRESIRLGAGMVICTCGLCPDEEEKQMADRNQCVIVSTQLDTYTAAMLIRQSMPIGYVMTTDKIITVRVDELIDDVKERMLKTRFRGYPVIGLDNKVKGMVSRYHLLSKKRKQAILLDHNEKSQTANGIEDAEILEIIDHHRLGDIQTTNPILMKNEPVGSTATIVASMYQESGIDMPQKTAGILLSAIISDTLRFQSPTSTQRDFDVAKQLSIIADVDIYDLALKIINAGSTLKGKTPDEIVGSDQKEYVIGKYKIGIAQVYSIDSENLFDIRPILFERMQHLCDKNGLAMFMLLVTDLNRNGSDILLVGDRKDIFYKAYGIQNNDEPIFLPAVLSRKKQVVPKIMSIEDEI